MVVRPVNNLLTMHFINLVLIVMIEENSIVGFIVLSGIRHWTTEQVTAVLA